MHLHTVHRSTPRHLRLGLDGGRVQPADVFGQADLPQQETELVKIVDFIEEIIDPVEFADFVAEVSWSRVGKFRPSRRRLLFCRSSRT